MDTAPPTVICPLPLTAAVQADCATTLPDLTSMMQFEDNCGILTTEQIPAPYSALNLGTIGVTFIVTDTSGNSANCTTPYTVTDKLTPTLTDCIAAVTLSVDSICENTVPNVMTNVLATDSCVSPVITQSPAVGQVLTIGSYVIGILFTANLSAYF